jgi:hypothetical protein
VWKQPSSASVFPSIYYRFGAVRETPYLMVIDTSMRFQLHSRGY